MKNKKMAVAGISLLGSIGVISTGFAGWIITAPAQRGSGTGAITADGTVETKGSLTLGTVTYDGGGAAGSIRFAANASSAGNGWLTSNDSAKAKMSTTITVPMTIGTKVNKINFTNVVLEATGDNKANYKTLADAGIVGSLPTLNATAGEPNTTAGSIVITGTKPNDVKMDSATLNGSSISTSVFTTGGTEASFNFTVNFAWGSKFGGQNPMDYYNNLPWSAENEKNAANAIKELNKLDGIGFKLSFTVAAAE
ncbi:MAG: hypothetical protein PUE65_00820 [Mollicutes bacterium]|nr:hypothetical protein [Mollicutes bacterium]